MKTGPPEIDFPRTDSAGGSVFVSPSRKEAIEALGLSRFGEAMSFFGGTIVDRNRKRSVVSVERDGTVFYLKRFTLPPAKDALAMLFSLKRPVTHAEREVAAARALERAGLGAPEVAAWGVESGNGLRRKSFLVTARLVDFVALDRFIGEGAPADGRGRAAFIDSLARAVRRMHDAGIGHPDLYSHHVFVKRKDPFEFAFIDLHRASVGKRVRLFEAVRDLTALHLTVARSRLTRTDRLRFVRAYFGGMIGAPGRRLIKKILKRSRRISGRSRFSA